MSKMIRKLSLVGAVIAGIYAIARIVARKHSEDNSIDVDNPYIKSSSNTEIAGDMYSLRLYEKNVKPVLDKTLSFMGLILLSPLMGMISLAVVLDDPGPVFFSQKRVGKDGYYFVLHKFRTMKMSAPHDIPTHQFSDSRKYITKIGKFLRKTSLDEYPQIWDIFRGKMSIIGPRPALWNQEDLIAEREKWNANSILPGLTGLAQIKGRDELEILDKAKLDGEYTEILRRGGVRAFFFDVKLFFLTVRSVITHNGVVEGGTGALTAYSDDSQNKIVTSIESPTADEAGFEEYGYKKKFRINKDRSVKVLITGAGSYIGESFKNYCEMHYPNIECTAVDMVDGSWRNFDFSGYDTVFHVAGIAHADVGKVNPEQQKLYYSVNSDLAVECCEKSRDAGIKQFIYMSSMIIYGGKEFIDEHTVPSPINFYGDSKWQGDKGVRALKTPTFHVAVIRSPMIYGYGSKGNYLVLSKIASKVPLFPNYENRRSMLYIENLCEFVSLLTLSGEGGVFFPQNSMYSNTSKVVKYIAAVQNRKIWTLKIFNPVIHLAHQIPGKVKGLSEKAFGNGWYDQRLSQYDGLEYQKISFEESIRRTEQ